MRQGVFVLMVVLLMSFLGFTQEKKIISSNGAKGEESKNDKSPAYEITLNFETNAILPYGAIELGDGNILKVNIINLPDENFEITVNGVLQEKKQDIVANPPGISKTGTSIFIIHRSEIVAYQVMVSHMAANVTRGWIIPIITTHWTVDFSGAFTVDALGKPSYYLEPGVKNNENGFYVRKNNDSSKLGLGTAAMVHLYYNKNNSKIKIIPLTFGIGVGTGSAVRYYIGPSIRFGGAGYLTVGAVLGDIDRPPVNAPLNSFVTDGNALANMTQKKKIHLFLGFSYSFTGSNAQQRLQQPFALTSPRTSTPGENNPERQYILFPSQDQPVIENVVYNKEDNTIIITGIGFGTKKANVRINFWPINNEEKSLVKMGELITEISNNRIIFDIGPNIKGYYQFMVAVNGIKSEIYGPIEIDSR